jgi:hypothetical protein
LGCAVSAQEEGKEREDSKTQSGKSKTKARAANKATAFADDYAAASAFVIRYFT